MIGYRFDFYQLPGFVRVFFDVILKLLELIIWFFETNS